MSPTQNHGPHWPPKLKVPEPPLRLAGFTGLVRQEAHLCVSCFTEQCQVFVLILTVRILCTATASSAVVVTRWWMSSTVRPIHCVRNETRSAIADCTARRVWNVIRASFLLGVGAFRPKFYGNGIIPCENVEYRSIGSWLRYNFAAESF